MDVVHTAIWVSDLDATRAFYEDHLGLSHSLDFESEEGVVNYFVTGEGPNEIQFKYDPDGHREITSSGLDHIAIVVEEFDATIDAVVASAGSIDDGPREQDGTRIAFGSDPDGHGLEFIEADTE